MPLESCEYHELSVIMMIKIGCRPDLHCLDGVVGVLNAVDGDEFGDMGKQQLVDNLEPVAAGLDGYERGHGG